MDAAEIQRIADTLGITRELVRDLPMSVVNEMLGAELKRRGQAEFTYRLFDRHDETIRTVDDRFVEGPVDSEYRLSGWFQGVEYDVGVPLGDSPVALVMAAVLGLGEGEEVVSCLVRTDGGLEVRAVRHGQGE